MEELGIGRPSTYASILQVLQDRGYVRIDKKRLIPEDKGRVVVAFLESFFQHYVEYDFTASLEEQLDRISNNEIDWKKVLRDFWTDFIGAVNDIKDLRITQVLDALNDLLEPHIFPARADGGDVRQCPHCGTGQLSLKVGRFGAFIGCSNYPECTFTRQMTPGAGGMQATKVLGIDPVTDLEVTLRGGRFGPYLQLGEEIKAAKPRKARRRIPTLPSRKAQARQPAEGRCARRHRSRQGAGAAGAAARSRQVAGRRRADHGRRRPLRTLRQARQDLCQPGSRRRRSHRRAQPRHASDRRKDRQSEKGGRRFGADPGKALGDHPDKGGPIVVKNGRYGPYVSHNGVNATLTGDKTPDTVTLDEAVVLLDARVGHDRQFAEGPPRRRPQERLRQGRGLARRQAEEAGCRQAEEGGRGRRPRRNRHAAPRRPPPSSWRSPISIIIIAKAVRALQIMLGAGKSILNKPTKRTPSLPSKADILAFIGKQPGKVGTREIARAFGLKNAMRAELKRMLRELADEGAVEKRRKKLHHPGTLPSTVLGRHHRARCRRRSHRHARRMGRGGARAGAENPHPHAAPGAARRGRRPRRPRAAARGGNRRRRRHPPPRPRHQDHRPPQAPRAGDFPQNAARRRTAGAGRQEDARQGTRHSGRQHRTTRKTATWSRSRRSARRAWGCRPGAWSSGSARSRANARSA